MFKFNTSLFLDVNISIINLNEYIMNLNEYIPSKKLNAAIM